MTARAPHFLALLLAPGQRPHQLVNVSTGKIVASQIVTAFDSRSRRIGLLGQARILSDTCLVIAPTNAIHTFFMKFAIDVAFVARDGRVVKAERGLKPWRIAAAFRAFAVVELPVGALDRSGTAAGDRFTVELR